MPLRRDPLPRVVRHTLTKREKVIISTRRHSAWLVPPVAILLAGTVFALWFAVNFPQTGALLTLLWCAWLVLVGRTAWFGYLWWRHAFIVTTERFILVDGGVTLTQTQLPLAFGKDITLRQNLVGQWLGFGDFVLETAPKEHPLHQVTWLPDCERLHRRITRLMQGDEGRHDTIPDMIPTYDDRVLIVDEASRNQMERVHRPAGGNEPVVKSARAPGLLSLWRGIRSTMPLAPVADDPPKRLIPLPRRRRRRDPDRTGTQRRNVTTVGKTPQPPNVIRKL